MKAKLSHQRALPEESLRHAGLKVTPHRMSILRVLQESQNPLTVLEIEKKLRRSVNATTVYRALLDLVESNIVRKVNFEHNHAHYELVDEDYHHHHLVCRLCGRVEDVQTCSLQAHVASLLQKSKQFASITDHALEYFGTCKACAR